MRTIVLMGVALMICVSGWAQPLIDYVNAPDDSFDWQFVREETVPGANVIHLSVTSQTWQDIVWTHRVQVLVPDTCTDTSVALMIITGGTPNTEHLTLLSSAATMIAAPIVILGDIPNQPLFDGLREDALIALTFSKYLETGEEDWPLLFPMTKAAVKTMDALEAWSAETWETPISKWVTTGASKRGWTTWFTGAVGGERLAGIIPMVYDNLDLAAQMRHQIEAWGDYSAQIHDYTERGLQGLLTTEEGARLSEIVDPFSLRDEIDVPKMIVTGTNDEYWPLDAANLYWDELVGPKYILYVPNSGHGLQDIVRVIYAEVGFFTICAGRAPAPQPTWEFEDAGYLRLQINPGETPVVKQVSAWTAHSPTRDFRGAQWKQDDTVERDGGYMARALHPEDGYTALFGEIIYDINGRDFPVSTNVRIIGPGGEVQ